MLTWAIAWLVAQMGWAEEGIGILFLFSMIFDTICIVAITACWWGKHIK